MNEIGMIGRMTGAFGADDVARLRLVFRKLRFQMNADTWAGGYAVISDAAAALIFLDRYRQTRDKRFRALALRTADRYLILDLPNTSQLQLLYPQPTNDSQILYPQPVADAIRLMLDAYRLTKDRKYLERADVFARLGIESFFSGFLLPRACTHADHYEAITRTDTLAMELLELWMVRNRPGLRFDLVWAER